MNGIIWTLAFFAILAGFALTLGGAADGLPLVRAISGV
jgi:hypothetical protein